MTAALRVVTLNTWKGDGAYGQRLQAMAAGLAALSPDAIALQEVLTAAEAGHDTAAYLAAALRLHAVNLKLRCKPRTVDGRTVDSTSGLAILSRFPIRSQRPVILSDDPRDGERAALIAEVEAHGQPFAIACLHLTHLADADKLRQRQWQEVQAALTGATAVAAGDFNAPIDRFDLGRFTDSRQACGEAARPTYVDATSAACIDHILFTGSRTFAATGWRTALGAPPPGCAVAPSDHLAVVADFTI